MKALVNFKVFVVLPLLLFVDYVLMILIGCSTCLLGFGDDFYCGPYCILGKLILGLSSVFFLFLFLPDIKGFFERVKNATNTKKRKSYMN